MQINNLGVQDDRLKILYIAGWGRSGSTVLGNTLGQIEGFFHVGELRYLWDRGLVDNWPCGCGKSFEDCEVWGSVMEEAFGGADRIDRQRMARLRVDSVRTRHLPLALAPGGRRLLGSRSERHLEMLETLYQAVRSTTGCDVIVDSSKFPSYAYLLQQIPSIDLRVVHLVRDPRAVAYSWVRARTRNLPFKSSMLWGSWNAFVEALWRRSSGRYMLVRYEDFVARPRESLERILRLVQEEGRALPLEGEHRVRFDVNHTVSGNPNRFRTGSIEFQPDQAWRSEMKRADRSVVTAVTWPLLLRYGYPLRVEKAAL